jgi:uncharacterized protein (TIGR03067 family)
LLATGALVVAVLAIVSFKGDVLRGWLRRRSDAERIQGKWQFVSITRTGKTESYIAQVIINGETLRVVKADGDIASYRLDEDHQPGWIDMIGPGGKSLPGIYELNGDTLRLCLNEKTQRPTAFEAEAGSRTALWVLQRE